MNSSGADHKNNVWSSGVPPPPQQQQQQQRAPHHQSVAPAATNNDEDGGGGGAIPYDEPPTENEDDDGGGGGGVAESFLDPLASGSASELPEDILEALDELQKVPPSTFTGHGAGKSGGRLHAGSGSSPVEGLWSQHHYRNNARGEPFNPNTYTTFNFKLRKLHNLRTASSDSTGDYIIRICFMGRVLGDYYSGAVDVVSLVQLSRHSQSMSKHLHCPSIILGHELSMHLRFRDLLDNPVLLTLAINGSNEQGEPHAPFAFTCLNMIELVNKGYGQTRKITQLWILVPERTPEDLICGFPLVSLDILGFTGLPTSTQLKQGNIMSVVIESMYRLPQSILDMANNPETGPNMEIHFTLPHSASEIESTLVFPGGHFKKVISSRVAAELGVSKGGGGGGRGGSSSRRNVHTISSSTTNYTTVTPAPSSIRRHDHDAAGTEGRASGGRTTAATTPSAFNLPESIEPSPVQLAEGIPVYVEQKAYRHWASILDYFPEAPYAASIVTGKQKIPRIRENIEAIGDIDMSGDSWRGHLSSSDTRIVWNALHRQYIGFEAYKQMLERLSKQTIWPLEVAVTIQKETSNTTTNNNNAPTSSSDRNNSATAASTSTNYNVFGDDGLQPGSSGFIAASDTVVIYHGVAFVDMTHLLYPGGKVSVRRGTEVKVKVKRSRFIYQLFPFNDVLFRAKTCAMKSAFLQTIRNSIDMGSKIMKGKSNEQASTAAAATPADGVSHRSKSTVGKKSLKRGGDVSKMEATTTTKFNKSYINNNTGPTTTPGRHHNSPTNQSKLTSQADLNAVRLSLLDESQTSTRPFIIFHIRLRRPLIPAVDSIPPHAVRKSLKNDHQLVKLPRKKLMNSITAEKQFRSGVLEASADLSQEFHTSFLNAVVRDGVAKGFLDPTSPASSVETIRKHFLFHLNTSGKYLTLREHLRSSISTIIQQKCTNLHTSRREYQQFLHDLYLYLVDQMHETLNGAALEEVDPIVNISQKGGGGGAKRRSSNRKKSCKKKSNKKKARISQGEILKKDTNSTGGGGGSTRTAKKSIMKLIHKKRRKNGKNLERLAKLDQLLMFSREAFAQGDYENAHRIHVERVARSGESSNCWAAFATMWLSRGDDRLAEIALREALLKNERNVKALIMSGVIAARHSDNRAIICLGAALNLVPHCPELMVLLGMAHACLGNDVASEYFFKKARFVHNILTGQSLDDIEKDFSLLAGQLPKDLAHARNTLDNDEPSKQYTIKRPTIVESDIMLKKNSGESAIQKDELGIIKFNENEDGGGGITNIGIKYSTYHGQETHSHLPTDNPIFQQHYHFNQQTPDFKFLDLVHEIKSAEYSKLPGLGPQDLILSWNVTKRSKGEKAVHAKKFASTHEKAVGAARSQSNTTNNNARYQPMNQIWISNKNQHAVDQQGDDDDDFLPLNLGGEQPGEEGGLADGTDDEEGSTGGEGPRNPPPSRHSSKHAIPPKISHTSLSKGAGGGAFSSSKSRKVKVGEYEQEELKIHTRRVGSELIWTAHLLLKLRLFDFLDGILARELAFHPERSVQVLYLRAVSLHLRGRDGEAIGFLHEALEKSPKNNALWSLRGHCYYNLKMSKDAFESYEKTLKLPHGKENLQLVYLRFGTLCLEKGLITLAKKVFLKGVHSFPSPYMWIAMGNTCYHMKEYQQAETSFAEANRLDNTNPIIWAHLSLVSLALGHQTLAEHSYKWAIRFGLKKGCRLMNELQQLHRETQGYGSSAFQRIPSCIPHKYYLQRLGKEHPFEEYKLNFGQTALQQYAKEYENSERENELIRRLQGQKPPLAKNVMEQIAAIKQAKADAASKAARLKKLELDGEGLTTTTNGVIDGKENNEESLAPELLAFPMLPDQTGRPKSTRHGSKSSKSTKSTKNLNKTKPPGEVAATATSPRPRRSLVRKSP